MFIASMLSSLVLLTIAFHVVTSRHVERADLETDRKIDPKGYRLNVVVFYDDSFAAQFKQQDKKVNEMMAIAKSALGHMSLNVKIQLETMTIHHAKGRKWNEDNVEQYLTQCGEEANKFKITDANSYLCLAGNHKVEGMQVGGIAKKGVVCEIDRKLRVAFVGMARYGSKYTADNPMGELSPKDAAFETGKTIAHELGHNLGMVHDYSGSVTNYKKNPSGKGVCMGYMDYTVVKDEKWSECSNADMKKYLNKLKPNCLKPIGTTGTSTGWTKSPEEDIAEPTANADGTFTCPPGAIC